MPIKDTFSYSARWNSVGLDCSYCIHFAGPTQWPDIERVSRCELHKMSLTIGLGRNGYKEWEWFCKDYKSNGRAFPKSVREFQVIQPQLRPNILNRLYGSNGFLVEYDFNELKTGG